jgi:hypothetical protein
MSEVPMTTVLVLVGLTVLVAVVLLVPAIWQLATETNEDGP